MPSIGPTELILVLVIATMLFGAGKLGDVGSALGTSIRQFRHSMTDPDEGAKSERESEEPSPAARADA